MATKVASVEEKPLLDEVHAANKEEPGRAEEDQRDQKGNITLEEEGSLYDHEADKSA